MEESKVTVREKLCFGLGDVTGNGLYTLLSSYLLFFCTDVLKIGLAATTIIMFAGRAADAVLSPVMGILLDYLKLKNGKCLPLLRLFMIPCGIWLWLLFSPPAFLSEHLLVWYMAVVFIAYSIHFAVINIAYSTLISVLTRNVHERLVLNVFKNLGANLGGFLVTASTLRLVSLLGEDQRSGFSRTVLVFAILFVFCGLCNAWNQKERVADHAKRERIKIRESIGIAIKNKGWVILCIVQFCALTYMVMRTQGITYYAKYILEDEAFGSLLLTTSSVVGLLIAFVMPWVAGKLGTKYCVIVGNVIWCVAMSANALVQERLPLVLGCNLLSNIGWNVATGTIFVMISETIDWSERQSGRRIDGLMMSVMVFLQKLGQTTAGVLTTQILEWFGYEADGRITEGVRQGILLNYIWFPVFFSLMIIGLMLFYPSRIPHGEAVKNK